MAHDCEGEFAKREGWRLLFWNLTHHFMNLLFVNLLFVACCIPVVTIGPALTAMNRLCCLMADNQPILYPAKEFWDAFRGNMRQGIPMGLLMAVYPAIIWYGMRVLNFVRSDSLILRMVLLLALLVYCMAAVYVFPQMAMIHLTVGQILNNAVRLMLTGLVPSLGAALVGGVVLLAPLFFWPMALLLYLVLLFSVSALVCCSFTWPQIRRHIMKKTEEADNLGTGC